MTRIIKPLLPLLVPMILAPGRVEARTDKPIIAVFNIEDSGVGLSNSMLVRLSDYLSMQLAATGEYQLVPRDQLKYRLTQQKKASYKACYAQTCQLEIGRELAAQKVLSTSIMRLGSRCTVTSVMYDLRRAASEGGASAEDTCDEDGIVTAIQDLVNKLGPKRAVSTRRRWATRAAADHRYRAAGQAYKWRYARKIERRRAKSIWGWTTLVAGTALVGAAAVLYSIGVSQGDEAHTAYLAATEPAPPKDLLALYQHRSDIESARSKIVAGSVLMGAGVVALSTAIYLFATRPEVPEGRATVGSRTRSALAAPKARSRTTSQPAGPSRNTFQARLGVYLSASGGALVASGSF